MPGTGSADAVEFLERLRKIAVGTPVLVLPYTDIDAVASIRSAQPDRVVEAVTEGRRLAGAILGPQAQLVTGVGWPIDGLIDPGTLSVLRATGQTTVVLDRTGVTGAEGDRAMIRSGSGDVTALLATTSVPESAVDLNHFTALTAQRWSSGDGTRRDDDRPAPQLAARRTEYAAFSALLRLLGREGLVEGVRIDQVVARAAAAAGPSAATLAYPDEAVSRELPPGLFNRVRQLTEAMDDTQSAFTPLPTRRPRHDRARRSVRRPAQWAARQAAGGFRADLGAGQPVQRRGAGGRSTACRPG